MQATTLLVFIPEALLCSHTTAELWGQEPA